MSNETCVYISIAKEFTDAPGGRFISDGPYSGEEFRERILKPALEKYDHVILTTEDLYGLPNCFISEALHLPPKDYGRVDVLGWI